MPEKLLPPLDEIHTVIFDFDGVFTNNKVWVDQDGRETVQCDRSDGLAFDLIRAFKRLGKINAEFFILSKESNPVVLARAKKLQLACNHGVRNKLQFVSDYFSTQMPENTNPFSGMVYLGNDLNDLAIMRKAGFAIAPSDAHPVIIEIAHMVFPQKGGDGFVRAFVEELLGVNQLNKDEINELIYNC